MDIGLLGPLQARIGSASCTPTAGKPRQVLALLALRAGEVVPVPTLIDELWGEEPPRSALTTLQTYVLQLRRRLAAHSSPARAKQILVTRFNGYSLDRDVVHVDAHEYQRLADAGARCTGLGDHVTGARLLAQALAMWSGPALVDVLTGEPLRIEVTRLEQSRLAALEARIDCDLHLGRHQLLLGELAMLGARYPLHEHFCGQFMLALYRSGQQWRALDVFLQLRHRLAEELGVEPSARLQRLQRAILSADPALDAPEARSQPAV